MKAQSPAVALDGCRVWQPLRSVEIVSADARLRAFPIRTSQTLGICLKSGGSHGVRADGRTLIYPADAICIRPPGCVWSSEAAAVRFLSVDIAREWLPNDGVSGAMTFGGARHLPDLAALVHRLRRSASLLESESVVAHLVTTIADVGALDVPMMRDEGAAARGTRRARDFLVAYACDNPSLEDVSSRAGVNKFVLVRWFRRLFGTTPHAFLMAVRVDYARALLASGMSPAESSVVTGFADQAHFSRWFKRLVGITPAAYARQTRQSLRSISFKTSPRIGR